MPNKIDDARPLNRALTLRERGVQWSAIEAMTGVSREAAQDHSGRPAAPKTLPPPNVRILTPRDRYFESAARAVSSFTGDTITAAQLRASPRDREESHVRFFAMAWLRWIYPDMSFPHIGRIFGVDHSTVQHAIKRASELYPTAPFCKRRRPDNLDARLEALGLAS